VDGETEYFRRNDGGRRGDEKPTRGQAYGAPLQNRRGAAAYGGVEVASRHSKEASVLGAVFARKLRINERTLEKWEQGRAKPNPQAAALVLLVRKYPDTLARLDALAR